MVTFRSVTAGVIAPVLLVFSTIAANATTITTVSPSAATAAALATATLATASGITIVSGTEAYIGADGQGGTYSGFSVTNGTTTIENADGVLLTTGVGDVPLTNTETSYDNNSSGTPPFPGTGANAQLAAVLAANSMASNTNDQNVLSFSFTVDPGVTSVSAGFVYGTEEYPSQGVTDIFGLFIDGVNYAKFPDGSLISYVNGSASSGFYNDNTFGITAPFDLEYNGITDNLAITGILNSNLLEHTFVLAIADTQDTVYDSGVFFAGLTAGTDASGGGIAPQMPVVPLPSSFVIMLTGLAGIGAYARRKKAKAHRHAMS
mgnify:CR=1 FL=1